MHNQDKQFLNNWVNNENQNLNRTQSNQFGQGEQANQFTQNHQISNPNPLLNQTYNSRLNNQMPTKFVVERMEEDDHFDLSEIRGSPRPNVVFDQRECTVRQQVDSIHKDYKDKFINLHKEHIKSEETMKKRIEELQANQRELEQDLGAKASELDILKTQLQQKESEFTVKVDELDRLQQADNSSNERFKKIELEHQEYKKKSFDMEKLITELKDEIRDTRKKNNAMKVLLLEKEGAQDEMKTSVDFLEASLKVKDIALVGKMTTVEAKLKEMREDEKVVKEQGAMVVETQKGMAEKQDVYLERVDATNEQVCQLKESVGKLTQQVAGLQANLMDPIHQNLNEITSILVNGLAPEIRKCEESRKRMAQEEQLLNKAHSDYKANITGKIDNFDRDLIMMKNKEMDKLRLSLPIIILSSFICILLTIIVMMIFQKR